MIGLLPARRKQYLVGAGSGQGFIKSLTPAAWFRLNTGITVTGAGVSTWADQSGNARDLLQGTDAFRPALQGDGSIIFDGADDFLKCTTFTFNQPVTYYALLKQITWTVNDHVMNGDVNSAAVFQSSTAPELRQFAGSQVNINAGLAVGAYGVVAAVFNGAASVLQINSTTVGPAGAGATNPAGFTLGAVGGGASGWSNIQVKEVILYAAAHDTATRAKVIRYLSGVGQLAI